MVKRVYGKLNGVDIVLHSVDGKWLVSVPSNAEGAYIVEIIAEDTAGNTAYLSKMLFLVTKTVVISYLLSLEYPGEVVDLYEVNLALEFDSELRYEFDTVLTELYLTDVVLI